VRVLADHSGVSQPAVSKHLGVLKLAGLVRDRREGRQTHFTLSDAFDQRFERWTRRRGKVRRERRTRGSK
jgi:DNA-binding transcriptional ArsR family regulator